MKTSTFILTITSAANLAAAVKFALGPPGWAESLGYNVTEVPQQSRLRARQAGGKTVIKNRLPNVPNAKSVKVRYGPFTVNGGGPNGGEGMIWNQPSPSITKPCSDCTVMGMNAGLEYLDGADANTDTKMWLHHMVLFNIGTGAWDATCTTFGLPHMIVGSVPASSERIFSSGNERTTVFFNPPWYNTTNIGYPVYTADRFGLITDLMNMNAGAKTVYLTMYYDLVDGHPQGFQEIKPVWFDVAQCGTSEVSGRTPNAKFTIDAGAWVANFDGEILHAGGHLHDGGVELDLVADGKVVCRSIPTYGTDQEALIRARAAIRGEVMPLKGKGSAAEMVGHYVDTTTDMAADPPAKGGAAAGGHGGSHTGMKHIIAMTICSDNKLGLKDYPLTTFDLKQLKKGQRWVLKAMYDYNQFPGMKKGNTNTMSTVMGIAIMYIKTSSKRKAG